MILSFYILTGLFLILYFFKVHLVREYIRKNEHTKDSFDESNFSIVQPLVSGDEVLENRLLSNLKNSSNINFVWIIDKEDIEAKNIVQRIKETDNYSSRIQIITVENIPEEFNRKTYKIKFATDFAKEYFIAVDDDTIINPSEIGKIYNKISTEKIIATGIPFYKSGKGVFSNLVTTFVNSNSLFVYLGTSEISPMKSVNGMFYVTKTEYLKELNAFEQIQDKLCDELELGILFAQNGYKVYQSIIPCQVTTTITNLKDYINLMKRWMIFAMHYMKEDFSFKTFVLSFLTMFIPLVTISFAWILGLKYILIYFLIHLSKSVFNYFFRRKIFNIEEKFYVIFVEVLTDFMQIFHCIHAMISPNKIIWRNHEIEIRGKEIKVK